jgi:hypothetical protein
MTPMPVVSFFLAFSKFLLKYHPLWISYVRNHNILWSGQVLRTLLACSAENLLLIIRLEGRIIPLV